MDNLFRLDDYRPATPPEPALDEDALVREANSILMHLDGKPEALAAWTKEGRQLLAGRRPVSA
jgi:hypothetical protein